MQLTHLTVLLTIAVAPTLNQKLPPSAVTSILQGMLSPQNTEQAIQMLTSAAKKKIASPSSPVTINRRYAIVDNFPRIAVRNEGLPNKACMQRPQEMTFSKNVILQKGNQIVVPKNLMIQRTEAVLPKKVFIQNSGEPMPRNIIIRKKEIPKRVFKQNGNEFSQRIPQMRPTEVVQQKVFISQPKLTEYVTVPQQKVYNRNDNPFLPAASPVSALVPPSSNAVPPVLPQSRGQFLRKIPIPPPTL